MHTMRIAISGTHGVGKTTLIDAFLQAHPEFAHEAEPYVTMVEELGEEFSEEPIVEDFRRQLDFNIERLRQYASGVKVVFERCPVDFLAYIDALDRKIAAALVDDVEHALNHLDLIVYLPLEAAPLESEYPKLQRAVDRRLQSILIDDDLGIIDTRVIEARGSTTQRLRIIEAEFL
jgi:broad-specificity NMP kinase